MIRQIDLGPTRMAQLRIVARLVRDGAVTLGGNQPGLIYGRLDCRAGKRMNPRNRLFFLDEADALAAGFRPCAVCLPVAYNQWKHDRHGHRAALINNLEE